MRQSDSKLVRALPLFSDMREENFDELMNAAFLQRFPKHVTLITEGSLPDFLHIVVEGSVEIFSGYDGQEIAIETMQPVSAFILAAAIRDDVYLASARTLTPAQVLMIPVKIVREVFGKDIAFASAIVNELALRFRSIMRALKNGKLRTGSERLANWILHADALQGNQQRIKMTISKRALASSLGMTPENLSRNFSVLAKYGVKSSGRNIVIEDASALEGFAKPNSLIDG